MTLAIVGQTRTSEISLCQRLVFLSALSCSNNHWWNRGKSHQWPCAYLIYVVLYRKAASSGTVKIQVFGRDSVQVLYYLKPTSLLHVLDVAAVLQVVLLYGYNHFVACNVLLLFDLGFVQFHDSNSILRIVTITLSFFRFTSFSLSLACCWPSVFFLTCRMAPRWKRMLKEKWYVYLQNWCALSFGTQNVLLRWLFSSSWRSCLIGVD